MPAVRQRWYFHKEATLNGCPTAPAGCYTLSQTTPDQTNAAGGGGGHLSTSSGADSSLLNKPTTIDETRTAGAAPTTAPPAAAHQFGWFTDAKMSGRFDVGGWTLVLRETDDDAGILGVWNVYFYANTARDFSATMRYLGDLIGTTDNWTGATTIQNQTLTGEGGWVLNNEYLFVQIWCRETAAFSAGKTLTLHQEGSDLTDAQRSNFLTTFFVDPVIDYSKSPPQGSAVGRGFA